MFVIYRLTEIPFDNLNKLIIADTWYTIRHNGASVQFYINQCLLLCKH